MAENGPEPDRGQHMDRRGLLKAAGMTAAAVGASGIVAQTAASAATPGTSAGAAAPATGALGLRVVDYVDGHYVVQVKSGAGASLRLRDGVKIQVTAGAAEVKADPYSGEILLRPTRAEALRARAVVPARTEAARIAGLTSSATEGSEDEPIGSDWDDLPLDEGNTALAGGGACAAFIPGGGVESLAAPMVAHLSADRKQAVLASVSDGVTSRLRVRAAVMGNVIPFSAEHREIRWKHARYYGTDDVLGALRFTYQMDKPSAVTMRSLGGKSFFPAQAQNELYCRMELLELGAAAISRDPMIFPAASIGWPVYSTPMHLAQPVTFYDEAAPDRVVMNIIENELALYDYNGVTIKKLGVKVEAGGRLRLSFRVTNQTQAPFTGRWMLIGDHSDTTFASTDAELTLGAAGSRTATKDVHINAPIRRRLLTQRVGFAVMSLSDPVALGISPVAFKYPHV